MLGKFGLTVVFTAGVALTLKTTAVSATPLVVELTGMYQPVKVATIALPGHTRGPVSGAPDR